MTDENYNLLSADLIRTRKKISSDLRLFLNSHSLSFCLTRLDSCFETSAFFLVNCMAKINHLIERSSLPECTE